MKTRITEIKESWDLRYMLKSGKHIDISLNSEGLEWAFTLFLNGLDTFVNNIAISYNNTEALLIQNNNYTYEPYHTEKNGKQVIKIYVEELKK